MYNLDSSMLKLYHEYVFLQICDKASDKIRSPLLRPLLLGNFLQSVQSLLPTVSVLILGREEGRSKKLRLPLSNFKNSKT